MPNIYLLFTMEPEASHELSHVNLRQFWDLKFSDKDTET